MFLFTVFATFLQMISGAEYGTRFHYDIIFVDAHKMASVEGEAISMTLKDETFRCKIPFNGDVYFENLPAQSTRSLYTQKVNNMPCLAWFDGREWLYYLCPKTEITQMHLTRQNFSLGSKFTDHFEERNLSDFYGGRKSYYFVRNYTNGDECEMTGKNRSTVAKFVCEPFGKDMIVSVAEISACMYTAEIKTKRVCSRNDLAGIPIFCGSEVDAKKLILKNYERFWINGRWVKDVGKKENGSNFILQFNASSNKDKKATKKDRTDTSSLDYFYYAEDLMLASLLEEDKSKISEFDLIDLRDIYALSKNNLNLSSVTTLRKHLNLKEALLFHLNTLSVFKFVKDIEDYYKKKDQK